MVWKTRYSVRLPMHMIQPRKRSLWVWKLGSVKATAKACKRASSDGMIDHTGGGSWLLGECQRHGFNLKYTEVLSPFPSLEICESSDMTKRLIYSRPLAGRANGERGGLQLW